MSMPTPQAWTSEHSAVRALTALGITHPVDFVSSLNQLTGMQLSGAVPDSFRREDKHTDLAFSTETGQQVFLEAKIDHAAGVKQLDRYIAEFPNADVILLVPEDDAPDVVEVVQQRGRVHVVTWRDLLEKLDDANPLARQLRSDIYALADMPGTKARVRRMLSGALGTRSTNAVKADLVDTAVGYPSIDVSAVGTYVFGQVESSRVATQPPRFTATIGFAVSGQDIDDEVAARRMRDALVKAWAAAVQVECSGDVRLSRDRHGSKFQDAFNLDEPYQARGYRDSHVGVKTQATNDAAEALGWALTLADEFIAISKAIWGEVS